MRYQPRDRGAICNFGYWDETIARWHSEGLPKEVGWGAGQCRPDECFGLDRYAGGHWGKMGLLPPFECKVIEDRGDHEVSQDADGVTVLRQKIGGSIPIRLGHTLTDRASWEKHFKPRLDPANPARLPADVEESRRIWNDPDRLFPRTLWGGSLYGVRQPVAFATLATGGLAVAPAR